MSFKVTFVGATTVLVSDGRTQWMTDGFFTRPSLGKVAFGRLRTNEQAVGWALDRLGVERLEAVFVTHTHYDHALDAGYVARRTGAKLYGSPSALNVGRGAGLGEERLCQYQVGAPLQVGDFTVTVLPGRHSPATMFNNDLGQAIEAPLQQPAHATRYKEGGSFDLHIRHGEQSLLIKPGANFVPGALEGVRAEVVMLSVARLARQPHAFRKALYAQVAAVRPRLLVPLHWDNFFRPLGTGLAWMPGLLDDARAAVDYLEERARRDGMEVRVLDGFEGLAVL
jgi:L-ascorbate metabolism protein UlaG (beta-lactamase superfamily)